MKKTGIYAASMLFITAAMGLQAQEKVLTVEVSNTWKEAKNYEPVVLNLDELNPGFEVKSAVIMAGTTEIPSQFDDLNGDGHADELAFLIDVEAKGKRSLSVTLSAKESDKRYPAQVHAQMRLSDK